METPVSIKNRAARKSLVSRLDEANELDERGLWELEEFRGENIEDSSQPFCPFHPSSTAWYWWKQCRICHNIYLKKLSLSDGSNKNFIFSFLSRHVPRDELEVSCTPAPDLRFGRCPVVDAYSYSCNRISGVESVFASTDAELDKNEARRARRRFKACERFPYCQPRKGTDTNVNSFTGRVLTTKRLGLDILGRHFDKPTKGAWKV